MKILGKVLGVALASLIAMPGAQARPRLGLGVALLPLAIVGGIAGAAIGSRKARAHRSHYSRHHARRERGAIRQARPAAPASGDGARDADTGSVPRHAGAGAVPRSVRRLGGSAVLATRL